VRLGSRVRASALFEGERLDGAEIFKLTEHSQRLHRSAEILEFKIRFSVAEIDRACKDAGARNGLQDGCIRPISRRRREPIGVRAQQVKVHTAVSV
jgi:branched-chain amino acid aminotransferase